MLRVDAALLFSTKGGDSESTDREPIFITELKTSPGDLQLSYLWFGQRGNIKNRRVAFVAEHASSCYYKSNSITLEPKISHNPTKEPFSLDPMFFFKSQTSRSGWWLHQGCFFPFRLSQTERSPQTHWRHYTAFFTGWVKGTLCMESAECYDVRFFLSFKGTC